MPPVQQAPIRGCSPTRRAHPVVESRPISRRIAIVFHQERMRDADDHAAQRAHWQATLDRLAVALDGLNKHWISSARGSATGSEALAASGESWWSPLRWDTHEPSGPKQRGPGQICAPRHTCG